MNYQEMIETLQKQRQENIQKMNELNVLIIKQEAQEQLLRYLLDQEAKQAEGQDGNDNS